MERVNVGGGPSRGRHDLIWRRLLWISIAGAIGCEVLTAAAPLIGGALGAYSSAVARARAEASPDDPRVLALEARVRELERAEAAEHAACAVGAYAPADPEAAARALEAEALTKARSALARRELALALRALRPKGRIFGASIAASDAGAPLPLDGGASREGGTP